ncbi:MAG TPA: alpha-amylase family glycosyl hydrolase, partial [Bacteroidales bacterium]|nr:alpha-amylase family glycosyl hydrolase [Bacteroidales bacterium]
MKDPIVAMTEIWEALYPGTGQELLKAFIKDLGKAVKEINIPPHKREWYKDAIVYSLYVDLFNKDFPGLEQKLDYLQDLGVNCLWLLPILDSPGKDAGFDISDYRSIRPDLLGLPAGASNEEKAGVFAGFLDKAHNRGIRVIFDIAINHTSNEHPWFKASRSSLSNEYRDFYIWSDSTRKYNEARIIFEGLCTSNWEKDGEQYYFHRFFEFQPDLNYRNPNVLLAMSENLVYWMKLGVDGFRADAIPYLWKEDGTACENLPETHLIVKFFRAVLDMVRPDTLLLAEACQKPLEVVKYFGDGDECHAGYHFPLMPQMFKALHMQSSDPVSQVLSKSVTPDILEESQWFTFLRCHDELSLELVYVTEEDRKYIHDNYCKRPEWDFRLGQGVSARLAELLDQNPEKIALAYAMMLSLPGTPVIYYGDEFGKLNDVDYYKEMIAMTGKDDTRFLVRGKIHWDIIEKALLDTENYHARVFSAIRHLIKTRKEY